MSTFYEVLKLEAVATTEEVRAAFKRQALAVHPDKGGCKEEFQQVLLAFETLSDAASRAKYDSRIGSTAARVNQPCSTGPADPLRQPARRSDLGCFRKAEPAKRQRLGETVRSGPEIRGSAAVGRCGGVAGSGAAAGTGAWHPQASSLRTSGVPEFAHWQEKLLGEWFTLLQRMPAAARLAAIRDHLAQQQRLMLESWGRRQKELVKDVCAARSTPLRGEISDIGASCSEVSSESSDSADDVELLMLGDDQPVSASEGDVAALVEASPCDEGEGRNQNLASRGPRRKVRGIGAHSFGDGTVYYNAIAMVESFGMQTKCGRDLSVTIDYLDILTTIKSRVRAAAGRGGTFASRFQSGLQETLSEYSLSADDIGLTFRVALAFPSYATFYSPVCKDLTKALQLHDASGSFRVGRGYGGRLTWRRLFKLLHGLDAALATLSSSLIFTVGLEKFHRTLADKLQAYSVAGRSPMLENCERQAMGSEDSRERMRMRLERRDRQLLQRFDTAIARWAHKEHVYAERARRLERDSRLRQLRRRDLTMDDILKYRQL